MTDRPFSAIDRLARAAKAGHLSRRDFLHQATAAGLSLTAASALAPGAARAQSQPQQGGTFRWGIHDGNTTDTHNPAQYTTRQEFFLALTFRSYLTLIAQDNSLGPDLATNWEASSDATTWTFELNPDATFHSGRPVLARDVIASINHHRGDESTSAAKTLLEPITDISAEGDHTVVFTLNQGLADFPWLMTDFHLAICPANEDGTIDWQSADGSGPYQIQGGEFGQRWSLTRFDGWHLDGAYFDAVEMLILNDPNARQTALVTGDVDCVSNIELKTMSLMQRRPEIAIDNIPSGSAITMPMFCDTAPFNDVNVRNALKLAMDRQDIQDKITFGASTIGNDFHIAPVQPFFPEEIPQREYDPDEARSLLRQAGAEGLSINLSVSDSIFSGAVDMCTLYAEHARQAGININVVREPADGYYSDVWLQKPFVVTNWGARPTPDVIFTLAYAKDAAWNESHWQNERFNELLVQARSELDQDRRAQMYTEMCQLMRNDGGTIIPFFQNYVFARRSNVAHPDQMAASWSCDGGRAASRWWFAS